MIVRCVNDDFLPSELGIVKGEEYEVEDVKTNEYLVNGRWLCKTRFKSCDVKGNWRPIPASEKPRVGDAYILPNGVLHTLSSVPRFTNDTIYYRRHQKHKLRLVW